MIEENKLKVIIVEDEQRIRNILKSSVEKISHCEVIGCANNGQTGLDIVRRLKPDIVFVDIMMPIMDGLEFSAKMRQRFPDIIVVVVSGYSDFSYAKQAMRHGVFNYMLKPIDDEELMNTIEEIKGIVQLNNDVVGSHILFSNEFLYEKADNYQNCYVFSITLGNLCTDNLDTVIYEHYKNIRKKIEWGYFVEHAKIDDYQWIITDEQTKNHFNIIIKTNGEEAEESLETIANNMFKYIKNVIEQDICVNICYSNKTAPFDEIWTTIKQLRKALNDSLVIGENRIIVLESYINMTNNELLDIVKLKLNDKAVDFDSISDIKAFRKDTGLIYNYIISNNPTQKVFEKILIYILRKFEFSIKSYDVDVFNDLQIELQRKISTAKTYADIEKAFSNCIGTFFDDLPKEKYSDYKTIFEYVESNFMKNISLEKVSDKFNYTGSHISRLFKNETGISFSRYITTKRMEMAKHLILKSDNSFNDIAQMVGYENGRYFSRVFRIETGTTPSEFKQRERGQV